MLPVSHYDSDFYHPPVGTDVYQWVTYSGMSYDEIDTEVEIAGLPEVHLIHAAGPGWYASDEYYFINDDQLFHIMILYTGDQEDWELYKFLQSFTLPWSAQTAQVCPAHSHSDESARLVPGRFIRAHSPAR